MGQLAAGDGGVEEAHGNLLFLMPGKFRASPFQGSPGSVEIHPLPRGGGHYQVGRVAPIAEAFYGRPRIDAFGIAGDSMTWECA